MKLHKKMKTILPLAAATAAFALSANAATVIPGVEIFAHNEKGNYGGEPQDVISMSGFNGVGQDDNAVQSGDPATWTRTYSGYQAEWQSGDLLAGGESPTNGKIGWAVIDLGSIQNLADLHIWHIRENPDRVATDFNILFANAPTVAPSNGPTSGTSIDYNFASGGWALHSNNTDGVRNGYDVIDVSGISARYIGLEILANNGDGIRTGFAAVAATAGAPIPEPTTTALLGLGGLALILRRRK